LQTGGAPGLSRCCRCPFLIALEAAPTDGPAAEGAARAMILDSILGLFSNDLAIDLGTANTLIYVKGEGIVCNEP